MRPDKQRVSGRDVLTPVSRPEAGGVTARPVDAPAFSQQDQTVQQLAAGLSRFNPQLANYVAVEAEVAIDEGKQARSVNAEMPQDSNEWFKKGYMALDGKVKGQADATDIAAAYETKFDKDGGNLEAFLTEQWKERTKGLQDEHFLAGYEKSIGNTFANIRKAHGEYQLGKIIDTAQANAQQSIENTIAPIVKRGEVPGQDVIEGIKGELKATLGVTGKTFNALLFNSVKRMGDEGNFAIFDILKRPNADGTPGMYFIPEWKTKIDAAQVHAQNVFLTNQTRATEAAKKAREEQQDTALYEVFAKATSGDTEGARLMFNEHVSKGLFSRASDITKWSEMLVKQERRDARGDQQVTQTRLLTDIYTGKAGIKDVINADLTPEQKRALVGEWYRKRNDDRSAALQAAANENHPYQQHSYKEQEDFIHANFRPQADLMGKFNNRNEFLSGVEAASKLELAEHVRTKGLTSLREAAVAIVERQRKRVEMFDAGQLDLAAKNLRYATPQETLEAARAGLLSKGDLALHMTYFKGRQPNGK